jgi:hypothetical protein
MPSIRNKVPSLELFIISKALERLKFAPAHPFSLKMLTDAVTLVTHKLPSSEAPGCAVVGPSHRQYSLPGAPDPRLRASGSLDGQ